MDINELMCPIMLDWLDDPISLPCCGREQSLDCPLCTRNIGHVNPYSIPKSVNLAYMIEEVVKIINYSRFNH